MLYAKDEFGRLVHASKAQKQQKYFCTCCTKPVLLKQGHFKRAHFAHEVLNDCFNFSIKKESREHLFCKQFVYQLMNDGNCYLEYYLHEIEQIPDVLLLPNIVFEIQLSMIPSEMIYMRTKGFHALGYNVFWIVDKQQLKFKGNTVKLNAFQHAMIEPRLLCLCYFDFSNNALYAMLLEQCVGFNTYRFRKIHIKGQHDVLKLKSCFNWHQITQLSLKDRKNYIQRCKQKKSVLEPTLSALYQLSMSHDLPIGIGIILPMQIYLQAHPIAWQTQILKGLTLDETVDFQKILKIHHYMQYHISSQEIMKQSIQSYFGILKEMRANLLEK